MLLRLQSGARRNLKKCFEDITDVYRHILVEQKGIDFVSRTSATNKAIGMLVRHKPSAQPPKLRL